MADTQVKNQVKKDKDREFKIDPAFLLERWGINNFSINKENLIIYLPELEFKKAAFQIGINIVDYTKYFYSFGWKWQKVS